MSVKLLTQVRIAIRTRHYSRRTEKAYIGWIKRFVRHHGLRHPQELGAPDVSAFLSSLAVTEHVSASTQNQALAALLFLYREVLHQSVPWLSDIVPARRSRRLPVVLTPEEVRAVLARLERPTRLVAGLLYGGGLRLLEALQLRVKDLDFLGAEIRIRAGKGGRDRVTVLPMRVQAGLQQHLQAVKRQYEMDRARGERVGSNSRMRSLGSIHGPGGNGSGSGSSLPAVCTATVTPGSNAGTTSTRVWCNGHFRGRWRRAESPSPRLVTLSGIRSLHISSPGAMTLEPCRNC
jgi:integrase